MAEDFLKGGGQETKNTGNEENVMEDTKGLHGVCRAGPGRCQGSEPRRNEEEECCSGVVYRKD